VARLELRAYKHFYDGNIVYRTDPDRRKTLVESIARTVPADRIVIAPSCSLLHIPFTLRYEEKMAPSVKSYLAFATERLEELNLLNALFRNAALSESAQASLEASRKALAERRQSADVTDPAVQSRMERIDTLRHKREVPFKERIVTQHERFGYKPLATTTIGSFVPSRFR